MVLVAGKSKETQRWHLANTHSAAHGRQVGVYNKDIFASEIPNPLPKHGP